MALTAIAVARGFGSILWDALKWLVTHPFHLAAVVLAIYVWNLRGDLADERKDHVADVAALEAKLAERTTERDNARADVSTAEAANTANLASVATLRKMLDDSMTLTEESQRAAETALAELQKVRQNLAAAARTEAATREALYASDPESAAWRDTPVPAGIAERLRQSASQGPPATP